MSRKSRGFTLVELLVVIGIIALLISILLPVLGKVRSAANSTKCLANLRTVGQAMVIYTNENKGAIPGSGNTSGRLFFDSAYATVAANSNTNNIPPGNPIEVFDFITPLSKALGLKSLNENAPKALDRFVAQADCVYFHCPSAEGLTATAFPVGSGPAVRIVSYNTASSFMMTPGNPTPGSTGYTRISTGTGWWTLPSGYFPKISKIGKSTEKIFLADGAKNTYQGGAPEYNISTAPVSSATTGNQSKYSDWGAFTINTSSYDQWSSSGRDGRLASFRHGSTRNRGQAGTYKLNAVFFDGHCESLDDKEATNPKYWVPVGTKFTDLSKIHPTVQQWHGITSGYVAP